MKTKLLSNNGIARFELALIISISIIPILSIITPAKDLAEIDSLLFSRDFQAHELAVNLLTKDGEVDTVTAVVKLMNFLKKEVENPTSETMAVGSYFTITGFIQHHYMLGLARLGHTAMDSLFKRLEYTTGSLRDRLTITLGLMNDPRVHSKLGALYGFSRDPFVRYEAISALATYKDTLDIPIFMKALQDDYYVIRSGYVKDTITTRTYIIKSQAAWILKEFGFNVKRYGSEFIVESDNK